MARTQWTTGSALRVVKQSPKPWLYMQSKTFFGKFVGPMGKARKNDTGDGIVISTNDNALCQIKMELMAKPGDKITFPMLAPLSSTGVIDDGDLEGNEEAMTAYDWSMELKSIGHAVRGNGDLSDRRVAFDPKQQATMALVRWMGRKIDEYTKCALSGLASSDGNVAEVAPAATRLWVGGQTAAGTLNKATSNLHANLDTATNHLMGPLVIEAVKRMAEMSIPVIRPIVIGGEDHYVLLLHPYQVKAVKATTAWPDIQKNANVRGAKNPIFTGALGMWDNVWLHSWPRIETRYGEGGATVSEYFNASGDPLDNGIYSARALFCGAQAVCQAYGRMPRRVTKMFDYGRKWGVGMDCHLVVGKPVFNSLDYGVIAVDTCYQPDA